MSDTESASPHDDKSFLKTLREAAMVERDDLTRFQMREAADAIHVALGEVASIASPANLRRLNSAWAHGVRILGRAKGAPDDAPIKGGLVDGARLAA